MKCILCDRTIEDYDIGFNHLEIDDSHSADICQECIGKFIRWQGGILSKAFPTKALKKRFQKG